MGVAAPQKRGRLREGEGQEEHQEEGRSLLIRLVVIVRRTILRSVYKYVTRSPRYAHAHTRRKDGKTIDAFGDGIGLNIATLRTWARGRGLSEWRQSA